MGDQVGMAVQQYQALDDVGFLGPVQAVFMQLFYSSFTSFSLLAVILALVLRAMGVLP